MSKRFIRGTRIVDVEDAVSEILAGRYIFERGKPQHPKWMANHSLELLKREVRYGHLYRAVDMKKEKSG